LLERREGGALGYALTNLPEVVGCAAAGRVWQARAEALRVQRRLRDLGLDHFEGRSWRGFHHHACLVLLADGFRLWR
jgi:SRSO17 transposase